MRKIIVSKDGDSDSAISVSDAIDIVELIQGPDMIYIHDEHQARKVIKAIRKVAKEMGWKV